MKFKTKRFRIEVTQVYTQTFYVDAVDEEHAQEIGSEISEVMEPSWENRMESNWNSTEVPDEYAPINYTPEAQYLSIENWLCGDEN